MLIIGDSRTRYMGLSGYAMVKDFVILAEGGATTGLVNVNSSGGIGVRLGQFYSDSIMNTLTNQVTAGSYVDLVSAVKAKKVSAIVYALGVNNMGSEVQYNMTIHTVPAVLKALKEATGCEVYFLSTLGVDEAVCKMRNIPTTNERINRFNRYMKASVSGTGIGYIDLNSKIDPVNHTKDGVHFTDSIIKTMVNYLHNYFY